MPTETYIGGRSIVQIIVELVAVWEKHRAVLAPALPSGVVSALDTIAAALAAIKAIDPPGPG